MKLVKVAAAAVNQTPLDWDGNQRRLVQLLRRAREANVGLLCLPELCTSGYGCEDAFLSAGTSAEAERVLVELLPETQGLAVSIGLPILARGGIYNGAALVVDGAIVGVAAKRHLAGDGLHYEPRWFKAWPDEVAGEIELGGKRCPIGDLVFEIDGVRVGFEICEDAWVANRPGVGLARAGVDIILNPSASHFAFGKLEVRKRFVLEGSRAFGASYVYANLLGNEAGRALYDGGPLIATEGRMVAAGRRLGFEEGELITAVVDVAATRAGRARLASFQPDPAAPGDRLVRVAHTWPEVSWEAPQVEAERWETGDHLKEEEMLRAIALGLWDYLRKSRNHGFVVSLSGGCDSAAVASLAAIALRLAWRALGPDGVRARLAHIPGVAACADVATLVERLITTAYQGTAQSSQVTRAAATGVAAALGTRHLELEIEPLVGAYVDMVAGGLGRPIRWQTDDLALQNIQARVRGPSVWLIANLEQKLLLTTSNRSEAAAGYATMDGDTCGGLAPVAGIDKAYLRKWLAWLAETGPVDLGPLPALYAVVCQRSTPELRPAEARQLSEEDLMPFEVLDVIERLAIRDKLTPVEVYERLRHERPADGARLAGWIERFFTLFARNQWKRERYAPTFHVDDENLESEDVVPVPDPLGGFARELEALRAAARAVQEKGAKR